MEVGKGTFRMYPSQRIPCGEDTNLRKLVAIPTHKYEHLEIYVLYIATSFLEMR